MASESGREGSGGSGGRPQLHAAALLGAAIVAGAFLVSRAIDRGAAELAAVGQALTDVKEALASAARPSVPAARPGRPDPDRRYQISLGSEPVRGAKDATVTIVEFSDFQCPFCQRVTTTLEQVEREYGGKVRIAFKHLPLSMHPKAPDAHAAAEAAHRQGKFWEMHDRIFENQQEMSPEKYVEYAREIGLDVGRFERDRASPEVKERIEADKRVADGLGVSGTPAFFVNGRYLSGAQPFDSFKELIDAELAQAKRS
jgi:protein-disulfide isomerase